MKVFRSFLDYPEVIGDADGIYILVFANSEPEARNLILEKAKKTGETVTAEMLNPESPEYLMVKEEHYEVFHVTKPRIGTWFKPAE